MPANWKRKVSNHLVVRTTQPQLEKETHSIRRTVDSTARDSTVRIERSFEDKEDDAITKFITESCGCTLGPRNHHALVSFPKTPSLSLTKTVFG